MMQNRKKLLKKLIEYTIYIAVALFIYTKLNGDWEKVSKSIHIDWLWFVIAIITFSFNSIWNGVNWHYLIKKSGEDVSLEGQMSVYLRSYLLRYIPGNVVGILSRGIYNQKYGVPLVKSLWGWFFENIIYLCLGLIFGTYVISRYGFSNSIASIVMVLALGAGFIVLMKNEWLKYVFNRFIRPRIPKNAKKEFETLDIELKDRVVLFFSYAFSWIIYSVSFLMIIKSVGVDLDSNIAIFISINALSWALGYLSIVTPSGTGVREAVMIVLLTNAVGLGNETSVIIALISRVVFTLGELFGFVEFYSVVLINKLLKRWKIKTQ